MLYVSLIVNHFSVPRETRQQQTGHLVCQPQRGNRSTLCCKSPNEASKRKQNDVNLAIENQQHLNLSFKGIERSLKQTKKEKEKEGKQASQASWKSMMKFSVEGLLNRLVVCQAGGVWVQGWVGRSIAIG